jgi:hypothetical protein
MSGDWRGTLWTFTVNFLYCNHQVHIVFLITLLYFPPPPSAEVEENNGAVLRSFLRLTSTDQTLDPTISHIFFPFLWTSMFVLCSIFSPSHEIRFVRCGPQAPRIAASTHGFKTASLRSWIWAKRKFLVQITFFFFKSLSTLQSVRRHSATVFDNHQRWHVGDISSDISPI